MRVRLLPVLIVAAALLLSLRVGGLWERVDVDLGSASLAQAEPPEPAAEPAAEAEPVEPAPEDDEAADVESGGDQTPDGGLETIAQDRMRLDLDDMTPGEIKVLEELATRRQVLEDKERDLEFREGLLKATEQRVEQKIDELRTLQAELEAMIDEKDEEEAAKITSLVEIYSKMKPKDAARVFERLDMDLLITVMGEMKERISAAILAEMDPQYASEITAEMAREEDLAAIPQ